MDLKNLISQIRARIRDEKEPFAYGEEILYNAISQEQQHICFAFNQGVSHFAAVVGNFAKKDADILPRIDNEFALPRSACKILGVFLNGKELARNGISNYLSKRAKNKQELALIPLSLQTYALYPKEQANGILEIFFIPAQEVNANTKDLMLESLFLDLLVLGCIRNLYQIEANAQNLQRVNFFSQAYNAERDRLYRVVSNLNAPNQIKTQFIF